MRPSEKQAWMLGAAVGAINRRDLTRAHTMTMFWWLGFEVGFRVKCKSRDEGKRVAAEYLLAGLDTGFAAGFRHGWAFEPMRESDE